MFACGLPAQAARARAPCLSRGAARCVANAASRLEKGAPGGAGGHAVGEFACPTLLNNVPYHTALRQHFYTELASSVVAAVRDGKTRMRTFQEMPELNVELDTYRIGTLLEGVRELVNALCADGKRVRVCVQHAMGTGVFTAVPLALNGVRRLLEGMDWGDAANDLREAGLLRVGGLSAEDAAAEDDDIFICIAPQNMNGHSIHGPLAAFCQAAGNRPVILINARLTDIPSANNVMSVRGRQERLDFEAEFEQVYHFRLIYNKPMIFPIYGCLRMAYGGPWELYKRVGVRENEAYRFTEAFAAEPLPPTITDAIRREV